MKKTSSDKVSLGENDLVKVKRMNHVIDVRHSTKTNYKPNIKKLDKNTYVEISTGEIKEFSHSENRQQNYNSLRQTFNRLRDLINNNFKGTANELHVTLTYKENMRDTERLYKDFKRFMTRLKRKFKDKTTIDYINVIEPQERGAWHCHVLIRFNELDKVFLSNNAVREMWEQGKIVSTKSLKNIDNIGAYLSAYLADIELTEETYKSVTGADDEVRIKEVDGKKFIKGGRLHMYPPGMNLYRTSKGIEAPAEEQMSFGRVKKIVGAATPHYQKAIHIQDEENDFEVTHSYLQYNTKRTPEK